MLSQSAKTQREASLDTSLNRGDTIRTCDLLLPKQALYQAELRPAKSDILTRIQLSILLDFLKSCSESLRSRFGPEIQF